MAKRYGVGIDVWEVWNEPDLASAWNPAPDPAAALVRPPEFRRR